jgi:asparagine synthase (glutamine-hydrolysing)
MLLALSHAAGADAAEVGLRREIAATGAPAVSVRAGRCLVGGWRHACPLSWRTHAVVEGWIERGPSDQEHDLFSSLSKATGDFALVAIDGDDLLVASGQGGGYRPVFVTATADGWIASTRLRSLLRLMPERPKIDVDFLAGELLTDEALEATATPYSGIARVPIGEAWRLRLGAAPERASVRRPPPREERQDRAEWPALLRETLDRCVRRATRGAKRVGVALSGGLDSSSVMLTLEGLRRRRLIDASVEAYSLDFETPNPEDDRPYRRCIEEAIGRPSHAIRAEEAGAFARRALVLDAAPCVDTPCLLWLPLDASAARDGIDRIVTGVGGDVVLDADPRLLASAARHGHWVESLATALSMQGVGALSWWRKPYHFVLRPQLRALAPRRLVLARARRAYRRRFPAIGPRLERWAEHRLQRPLPEVGFTSTPEERYEALAGMPLLSQTALIRSQQEDVTVVRRADPLFDEELLRFIATLPPLALFAGGFARGLLRQAMTNVLPERVRLRPWKAHMDPAIASAVAAAGGFRAFEDLADASRLADLGLIEPKRFRAQFDRLAHDPGQPIWWSVWPVLAVEEFLRQYDAGGLN